jgi:hypothetical protein
VALWDSTTEDEALEVSSSLLVASSLDELNGERQRRVAERAAPRLRVGPPRPRGAAVDLPRAAETLGAAAWLGRVGGGPRAVPVTDLSISASRARSNASVVAAAVRSRDAASPLPAASFLCFAAGGGALTM